MDEDELDPRIQVELEKLNSATDVINKLEIELDEANTTFRMLLNECTRRLKIHSSKHGSAIENARPYYEALDIARRAQQDCQQAAVSFQRANEVHEAAKETVALAESRFMSQQPEWRFDSAWQEMLNHATLKVRDAEKQRAESSAHHGVATARYKDAQEKVQLLEQRLRRNVAKSRPYFEEKQRCNEQLAAQKEAVETLAAKVARVKSEYAASLRRLEGISEEIHRRRGTMQMGGCGVREPGVGAELEYTGEQTNCDTSREASFDATSYNYDAKFNANNLPDSNKNNSVFHSKDCQEVGEVDARFVVGDFQTRDDTLTKLPGAHSEPDSRGKVLRETTLDSQTACESKISFESLHGLHFNPTKDFGLHFDDSECDSENETSKPTDVSLDLIPEFVPSETEASSSYAQGKYSLDANRKLYGEVVAVEEGVRDNGATDNNLDIREKGEDDSCNVKSEMDVNATCGQLEAIALQEGDLGARKEDVDIKKVARGMSENAVVPDDISAQGDAGQAAGGSTNQVPGDRRHKEMLVGSGSEAARQPDLEIRFQQGASKHEVITNNDGEATLESTETRRSVNPRDDSH